MDKTTINGQKIRAYNYNTVIVGAGAAGMNCAVHLYEFMTEKGIEDAQDRIAVVTGGLALGASRMSGSDKQTYYKMGTSPDTADSATEFAKSLTAAGCCHHDLAIAEAIGSLREFYHLVRAGVPFPHDTMGSFIGYKTDHDPYERATSAGPKTSRFMSQCLEKQVRKYGIEIHDHKQVAQFITVGGGDSKRIVGVVTIDKKKLADDDYAITVYYCRNLVLAAGGPGELYATTVYPKGQAGIHGSAFKAGLVAQNLTESQFGLASTKFRWNVSGSYCQVIPRIFSTDNDGSDERDFLADFFPTMSKMATNIFLKGYQWPFDPQRIENQQSSLVDILVFNETQKGRRVFMDFRNNPVGSESMDEFDIGDLEPEVVEYLKKTDTIQATPIERLAHLNRPAIEIYTENGIDLYIEPLEIAVCAQHNNGGFAVDKWWQSNIPHTFVIGEMAGTHGVKRPGGSALNAGQVGGLRAAEYIANVYDAELADYSEDQNEIEKQLHQFIESLNHHNSSSMSNPTEFIKRIQKRMTTSAAHIREHNDARNALAEALNEYKQIKTKDFKLQSAKNIATAIKAEHMALTGIAFLTAIVTLIEQGGGSRGSHLVLSDRGIEIHSDIIDQTSGKPLNFRPENEALRNSILQIRYDPEKQELFSCDNVPVRKSPTDGRAFELIWRDFREADIYSD